MQRKWPNRNGSSRDPRYDPSKVRKKCIKPTKLCQVNSAMKNKGLEAVTVVTRWLIHVKIKSFILTDEK